MKRTTLHTIIACLVLMVFSPSLNGLRAQTEITAIDILLEPDETMLDSAKVYNAILQKNYSGAGSYSLDSLHKPHITVLQCFVRSAELEKVYAAVAQVVKKERPTKETLTSKGFYYYPVKDLGLAGITINTTPALLRFQSRIIEVLKPYLVVGTDSAFVQNEDGTPIATGSKEYVNGFIPDHSGKKYNPHVTIGLAHEDFLKKLLIKPHTSFPFKCTSVSIYHLGDFGTAREKLWTSSK